MYRFPAHPCPCVANIVANIKETRDADKKPDRGDRDRSGFGIRLAGGGLTPSAAHAQMSSALAEAQDIRQRWPDALVHFPYEASWAGAEFVGGTPMFTRATAEEAPGFDLIGYPLTPYAPCDDSAGGGRCPVDSDGDGVFTAFDLMILEEWAQEGDPRADINQDGHIDLFDRHEAVQIGMGCW